MSNKIIDVELQILNADKSDKTHLFKTNTEKFTKTNLDDKQFMLEIIENLKQTKKSSDLFLSEIIDKR